MHRKAIPEPAEPSPSNRTTIGKLTEADEDMETEDDSYLQELDQFIKDPMNLNYADEGQLQELKLLTPFANK